MTFQSILFETGHNPIPETLEAPPFFGDLNLNQILDSITADWKEYHLAPIYYTHLNDVDTIEYRQEIMGDLEGAALMEAVKRFSRQMHDMRERLDQAKNLSHYKYAMQRRFMGAVEGYCEAVGRLKKDLAELNINSRGLRAFREYVTEYAASAPFRNLVAEITKLRSDLSAIRYCFVIEDGAVTVRPFHGESDYSIEIEQTFAKFRQATTNRYQLDIREREGMNHIEGQILDRAALMYPATFRDLDRFCTTHVDYLDERLSQFDREIHFYIAYLVYIEKFQRAGLGFCRPIMSQTSKETRVQNAFDLALADRLIGEHSAVVPNHFSLTGSERILVVTGPNQGGKTTFARMFGQLHYLASLGCPVPGTEAQLFVFDRLFTHFERDEDITNLRGRLQGDLIRVRQIFDEATPNSLIIINELFSSTTVRDALFLNKQMMQNISDLDLLCAWVTFLDELASFNDKTVSMVSVVDPDNPAVRTFRLERRPSDGLAYALAIARKHHMTYDWLKERIKA